MIEILWLLVYVLAIGALFWLTVAVLRAVGIAIPERVIQIVALLVFVLIVIWFLQGGLPHGLPTR